MKKLLFISGVGVMAYAGYKAYEEQFAEKAFEFLKENFQFRVSGAKIHRLDRGGLDLRITADLINISSVSAQASNLKADVYYMKNGSPSHLSTTTINTPFVIKAKDTTRITDMKVLVPYRSLLANLSIFKAMPRAFKVIITTTVNGQQISLTQDFSVA